ncbi:MAG: hypothetical protein LPD71_09800 [Shewanella sp.]|nr:hypothetical protein [Shewanella sp.]MCF1439017.1 hypothetical protein [Shewanella sp.]MCF1456674.1 hypothetical protein [Shewanella sp.]
MSTSGTQLYLWFQLIELPLAVDAMTDEIIGAQINLEAYEGIVASRRNSTKPAMSSNHSGKKNPA